MKCRFIEVVGKQLHVWLKDEDGNISIPLTFNQILPVDIKLDELPEDMTWAYLKTQYHLPLISMGLINVYNTIDGKPHPGDMYWSNINEDTYWDNHKGPHLFAILPNGDEWNIDSRARNCTLPKDRLHRCWVRKGEPPNITVGKGGVTCSAGAGSIQSGNYHGMLTNGIFKP